MQDPLLVELLELGIKLKRRGEYKKSLAIYDNAVTHNPTDKRAYMNRAKVLFGTGNYQQAVPNLLTNLHLQLYNEEYYHDPLLEMVIFNQSLAAFELNETIIEELGTFQPRLIQDAVDQHELARKLVRYKDNLLFYLGHAYIGLGIGTIKYDPLAFENTNRSVLGLTFGNPTRETSEYDFFCSVGFVFAHMNISSSLNPDDSIFDYYSNTALTTNICDYHSFLSPNDIDSAMDSEMEIIDCHIAGVTYNGRQKAIAKITTQTKIQLIRDGANRYDRNAIKIITEHGDELGFIPARISAKLARRIDSGKTNSATIRKIVGGGTCHYGVAISCKIEH